MNVEHVGYQHPDPVAAAKWFGEHLGLKAVRSMAQPPYTHFFADSSGRVVFEIYKNPDAPMPDYASQDILVFHLAFESTDACADRDRLVAAGATVAVDPSDDITPGEDLVITLRDPWGVPFQFAMRGKPMV
jgi:catechol 2,3-dioxygenase-like lactoylglutathione lyase family enzyme